MTVSHWQARFAQPGKRLSNTKALSQPQLNGPQTFQTPKEPRMRRPSWGGSCPQSLGCCCLSITSGLGDQLHVLRRKVYHFHIIIYLSILDCRRRGATGELYAVKCHDQTCIFKRSPHCHGGWGGKTRSWNIVRGHSMDLGRKWQGSDGWNKGCGEVHVHNCRWGWRRSPKVKKTKTYPGFQLFYQD